MIYKFKENRVRRAYFGGSRIDKFVGKEPAKDGRYPEEWLASTVTAFNPDMPKANEGLSICENGRFFTDIIKENPKSILGKDYESGTLSILVKLLDSAGRLVIQCHPTIPFAKKYFGSDFGKTECWYILDAAEDANVYLGFKEGITREKWVELYKNQDVDGMLNALHNFKVKPGDLWFVDGGVPHAIGGGCFMIELQEPSDLMVIPEKVTPMGIVLDERKLHGGLGFEKMFDCYNYNGLSREETQKRYYRTADSGVNGLQTVVGADLTDKFKMSLLRIENEAEVDFNGSYAVAVVTKGNCKIFESGKVCGAAKGDKFFLSADAGKIKFTGNAEIVFCFK